MVGKSSSIIGGLVGVIPLLGVKTRCAEKSMAEHYKIHTYICPAYCNVKTQINKTHREKFE